MPQPRYPSPLEHPPLLSPRQLAHRWGMSAKTLERWRMEGTGPVYLKLGGRIMYRLHEVLEHEHQRIRISTSASARTPASTWAALTQAQGQ